MTITIEEKVGSRSGTVEPGQSRVELEYIVMGTNDDAEVHTLVQATHPSTYLGLAAQGYRLQHLGAGHWEVSVRFGTRESRSVGTSSFSFDIGGQSVNIKQSKSTASASKAAGVDGAVPDYKKSINVSRDGVEGVDIQVPVFEFAETHYLADEIVTSIYKRMLLRLTSTTNLMPFRGFEAGEVLFQGARGSQRGSDGVWEISFNFAASLNQTGLSIAGSLPFDKQGWHYLWVQYKDAQTGFNLMPQPKYIFVERIYEESDFSELGIGV